MPPKLWHWQYFRVRPQDLSNPEITTKDYHGKNHTFSNTWCIACLEYEMDKLKQQDEEALHRGQITQIRSKDDCLSDAFSLVPPVSGRRESFESHIRKCERIHPSAKDHLKQGASSRVSGPPEGQYAPGTSSQTSSGPTGPPFRSQPQPIAKLSPEQQKRFESDLCKLFVANGYAWNTVNNPQTMIFYQTWIPGASLPDRRKLLGSILQQEIQLANMAMQDAVRGSIATGMSDGWKNIKRTALLASMLSVNYQTYTVKVHDISTIPKTADNHLRIVKSDIDQAEKEYKVKVIAWVSDVGGDSRAMRVRLHRERPHILVFDCWAHQVNLIVGDILKLNSELVQAGEKAIQIIRWMLHHSQLLALLHEEQLRLTGTTHTFNIPCTTRWTSHFLSFTSLINSQQPLLSLLVSKPDEFRASAGRSPEALKELEGLTKSIEDRRFWWNLNELKGYLEPLAIAANVSQAPTTRLDHILVELGRLFRTYQLYALNPAVRQCVLESLERRWGKCDQDPFILAIFLNPFIRARLFNPNNTSLNRSALYGVAKRVFRRIFRRDADIHLYEAFIDYYASRNEFSSDKWDYEEVKEIYERAGKPIDLVVIWSGLLAHNTANSGRHQLVHLAIHVLSIVANSAGCERLFSEMGYIHTKRRNHLSYEKVFDTAVVKMNLKRQHAALGLTRARLKREFGISTSHPDGVASLSEGGQDAEKNQHDEAGEEVAEIDMLDDDNTAYGMTALAARLHRDTIDDEDPEDESEEREELEEPEEEHRNPEGPKELPKRVRLFFGTQYPIRLQDLFDYGTSMPTGQGLDYFMQSGLANLQKELEIYDLATRDMFKSIMYASPLG